MTEKLENGFICGKCENNTRDAAKPLQRLCDEVETGRVFCYLGDRVNADGRIDAAVTARMRIGWMKFRE